MIDIWILVILSSIIFFFSSYFAIKLYRETDRELYWFFLVIAAFAFTFHSWVYMPYRFNIIDYETFYLMMNTGEIVGGFSLAYAAFGLYNSMRKIRKRVSQRIK